MFMSYDVKKFAETSQKSASPQKAIIFARVSSVNQAEGHSLNAQVSRLQSYCKQNNLEVVKEFSIIESSKTGDKKEFLEMIDFIKKQKTKIILACDSIDRLYRGFKEISYIDDLIKNDKLEIIFVKDNQIINNIMYENILSQIHLSIFGNCSKNLSDNVKRGIKSKLQNGEWIGKAPFGYKNITLENGKKDIVFDEEKFDILVEIFISFLSGEKLKDISQKFTLSRRVILNILKNPFYCGKMYVKKYNKFYPHKYQTIVPQRIFDECQKIIQSKERLIKKV